MYEKEIIIDDFKIRYSERQKTSGDIFIFLHGWGSNYKSFSLIYSNLDNYIAFDFPGFGGSSNLKRPLALKDYAKLTMTFINMKVPERNIVFVVHSFGGRVLLRLLNENKIKNVKQIICIGVPFLRNYNYKHKIISALTKVFKIIFSIFPQFLSDKAKGVWYKAIGNSDYAMLESTTMRQTFLNIINEDIFKISYVLKDYKTDFIWGSNDKEAPLYGAKVISKKVKATLHIIKNGGHFPFAGKTADEFEKTFKQITKI